MKKAWQMGSAGLTASKQNRYMYRCPQFQFDTNHISADNRGACPDHHASATIPGRQAVVTDDVS